MTENSTAKRSHRGRLAESRAGRLLARSRPRFWLYLAGPALVGAVWGATTPSQVLEPVVIALVVYFLVPANVFLYGVNDAFDADVDRENPKKAADGREVRYVAARDRGHLLGSVVAGVLALAFLPLLPPAGVLGLLAFLALGVAYSAPPLRFKTTPLLDSLSNGLYVLPGVVTYVAVAGTLPPLLAVLGGWLWTMAMHTYSAIPDVGADRAAGIRTTATVLGRKNALAYCVACWLAAAVAMAALDPALGILFVVYPFFGAAIAVRGITYDRAYWWFPALNAVTGAILTMGGIWLLHAG